MPWIVLKTALPYLAVLMYALVTAVLTVLASRRRHAIEVHDRVRGARSMRKDYLDSIHHRIKTPGRRPRSRVV